MAVTSADFRLLTQLGHRDLVWQPIGAFIILEAALIGVDYLVPNEGDVPGAVVR